MIHLSRSVSRRHAASIHSLYTRSFLRSNQELTRASQLQERRLLSTYPSYPRTVGPPPPLFDLILRLRFDKVIERAASHPQEARYPHPRRWTALHACCEHGAPLEVVKAVVHAHPEALEMKDWRGMTPRDVALEADVKNYLESMDVAELTKVGDVDEKSDNISAESSVALERGEGDGDVMKLVDRLSQQVLQLTSQCHQLAKDVDRLREELKKRN